MSSISIVCFAFNEESNLPVLYDRLKTVMAGLAAEWEWVIVDDHSTDSTFRVISTMAARDPRIRGFRLSRNFGAHSAKACGLHHAAGDCAIAMAADLQDPPELIPELVKRWEAGAQVVSAARVRRPGERRTTVFLSRLYHSLMRHVIGIKELPPTADSFCLLDRRALDAFRQFQEVYVPVTVLINWMGFRHERIPYDQPPRLHGRSGWTLEKKIQLALDSVTSFSDRPLRLMASFGALVAFAGLLSAIRAIYLASTGLPVRGWVWLMSATLGIGGLQIVMLGVLGEYVWRALSEAQRRPRYLIEEAVGVGRSFVSLQSGNLNSGS